MLIYFLCCAIIYSQSFHDLCLYWPWTGASQKLCCIPNGITKRLQDMTNPQDNEMEIFRWKLENSWKSNSNILSAYQLFQKISRDNHYLTENITSNCDQHVCQNDSQAWLKIMLQIWVWDEAASLIFKASYLLHFISFRNMKG
jgi:hypothetical protein